MNIKRAARATIEVCRRQHKARSTEQTYVHWLRRYAGALAAMPADLSSEKKLERFLSDLALRCDVSASTQNQAFNAICFFYTAVLDRPLQNVDALRATRPDRVRHAPTVQETRDLIGAVKNVGGYPTNLIVRLLYGCGLRVTEPLNLRIKDVAIDAGQKIRLPVQLPHLLASKYPECKFSWPWAWLFPAHWPCKDFHSGELVRYRMHEANVQRAVKQARRKLGIMVLPHELRHAYATHTLDRGVNIKALQAAMGHVDVNTTMGYCHAEACSVPSPLEVLRK